MYLAPRFWVEHNVPVIDHDGGVYPSHGWILQPQWCGPTDPVMAGAQAQLGPGIRPIQHIEFERGVFTRCGTDRHIGDDHDVLLRELGVFYQGSTRVKPRSLTKMFAQQRVEKCPSEPTITVHHELAWPGEVVSTQQKFQCHDPSPSVTLLRAVSRCSTHQPTG